MLAALAAAVAVYGNGEWSACVETLCGVPALASYFDALEARRSIEGAPPVHILQIGDSHSAGDSISGAWRDILQSRYGYGGRGVMPAGKPFIGFLPHGVHVEQSDGWRVEGIFGKGLAPSDDRAVFGVSGFRLTALRDGASISITAEPKAAFNRLVVCAVTGPGAGGYVVNLGPVVTRVSLAGPTGAACNTFLAPVRQDAATLTTQGGPVTLLSWASFTGASGVVVSNLGVVGAQLRHFERTNDRAVAEELRAYAPDLIVLEFGTNEGFVEHFDPVDYEYVLRAAIVRLRRLSQAAPILVLGAPDANTDRPDLAHNAGSYGGYASGAWFPPPALAEIRAIQKRVALSEGAAYWDWGQRMGGPGTADRWANMDPPRMRRDRVHYTSAGGAEIARLLQDDLDRAEARSAPSR
jgi:lysophospholipase L1-like esterase